MASANAPSDMPRPSSYPASPMRNINGPYVESAPASSTPTLNIPFDRANGGSTPPLATSLWPHRLSASFSAMADQIAAASQALALVPSAAFSGTDVAAEMSALKTRLDGIEKTQGRLMDDFETLKMQFATFGIDHSGRQSTGEDAEAEGGEEGAKTDTASKIEELEKKLSALSEVVRLDQERLPARLHNSRATVMKGPIRAPVAANGKPAPGFPVTRGEFEHITKERYEALMKVYGLALKGDTAAKRESLRAFCGIPQDGQ